MSEVVFHLKKVFFFFVAFIACVCEFYFCCFGFSFFSMRKFDQSISQKTNIFNDHILNKADRRKRKTNNIEHITWAKKKEEKNYT